MFPQSQMKSFNEEEDNGEETKENAGNKIKKLDLNDDNLSDSSEMEPSYSDEE